MDTNGQDSNRLHLGNLENSRLDVFKFMANRLDKGRFFSQNHLVCDVTIILSDE